MSRRLLWMMRRYALVGLVGCVLVLIIFGPSLLRSVREFGGVAQYVGMFPDKPDESPEELYRKMARDHLKELFANSLPAYKQALERHSDGSKVIILAMIDFGYLDMVANFHETTIHPLGLTNVLFVSLNEKACKKLVQLQIPCVAIMNDSEADSHSLYMSKAFLHKMNVRTSFTLQALLLGYSVLQTDVDEIWFKSPMPYLGKCSNCIIEALEDGIDDYINAGFVFLKSRPQTIDIYSQMVAKSIKDPGSEDQTNINRLVKLNGAPHKMLNTSEFLCGTCYYERSAVRYYADEAPPCPHCVVAHNNWIVSKEAKVYRAKEMSQWIYDDNGYYSNTSTKYLTYENDQTRPFDGGQKRALVNALLIGRVLNRVVILPKFGCGGKSCPLNSHLCIKSFDQCFSGMYREHMFLQHPKVPSEIKEGRTERILFRNPATSPRPPYTVLVDSGKISTGELLRTLKDKSSDAVLSFSTLHDVDITSSDSKEAKLFEQNVRRCFVGDNYQQLKHY